MQKIPWQRWAITFTVLILLGLAADYFFLHFLFEKKRLTEHQTTLSETNPSTTSTSNGSNVPGTGSSTLATTTALAAPESIVPDTPAEVDNFLKSLQTCRPDISSQGVSTLEALIEYLQKSVGQLEVTKDIENFHIILPDGSERRLHFIPSDSHPDSAKVIELRYFKIDAEGYPERIPLKPEQTFNPSADFINSLLQQGDLKLHQVKSIIKLKDGGTLSLETHNDKVYEFQLRENDKTLSCRKLSCQCQ